MVETGEDISICQCMFTIFQLIPLGKAWPFICSEFHPLYSRMLCIKFDWNWPSGSGEEYKNVKSLQTDRHTSDDRAIALKIWMTL